MNIALEKRLKKPDFVIIGTQKGGTTWLRKVLREHPNVYMPPSPEEVHFFNRSLAQPDIYLALFHVPAAMDKAIGEKSPNYFHMPEKCIQFMHELMPEAKLIVLLRDPVQRAWSQARMSASSFNQKALTRKDLLRLVLEVASKGNFERTNYAAVLKKWLKYFDREQIAVYYYEDLKQDSQRFLNQVCSSLDLPHFTPANLDQKVHVSKSFPMPKWLAWFLHHRYRKIPRQLDKLGYKAPVSWLQKKPSISLLQRLLIVLLFAPYHVFSSLLYPLYKYNVSRKIRAPRIFYID